MKYNGKVESIKEKNEHEEQTNANGWSQKETMHWEMETERKTKARVQTESNQPIHRSPLDLPPVKTDTETVGNDSGFMLCGCSSVEDFWTESGRNRPVLTPRENS
jgi:hypothetical protein